MAGTTSSSSSSSSTSTTTTNNAFSDEAWGEAKRTFQKAMELYHLNRSGSDDGGRNSNDRKTTTIIPENLVERIQDLELEVAQPDFWNAEMKQRRDYVTKQLSSYTRLQTQIQQWEGYIEDGQMAMELYQLGNEGSTSSGQDDSSDQATTTSTSTSSTLSMEEKVMLLKELQTAGRLLLADCEQFQLQSLLSGPYDDQSCRILLTAGAGGTEANDWVADLRRMYERHAEKMGFLCQVEDSQPGDVVGYKSVEMIISSSSSSSSSSSAMKHNQHPYGWFKYEKGAHRLVRLSPFNANNKRQTTFAGVDVAPVFDEDNDDTLKMTLQSLSIPDKDLEITTMRSGGAGGQNVNKVNSAVRIKHLPSGLQVKCTQERSQAQNKDLALKRLKAQLLAIAKEQRVAEIQEIRGDQVEASWGAQIRNYVLHPYKLVKDQRTNWETSDTQGFLDGELQDCIASLLRHHALQEQQRALSEEEDN